MRKGRRRGRGVRKGRRRGGSEERGRQQVVSYMYICLTGHSIVLSTNCEDNERVFLTI